MRKKLISFTVLMIGLMVFGSSLIVKARQNTITKKYDVYTITCYINCTNNYGEGSTAGAGMDGTRNYIKVNTYDINQKFIGYAQNYSIADAKARVSKGNPYLTRTYHAVANSEKVQLLPAYEQIQQAQGR